ncbi:hypothetical protein OF83DRAFT_1136737 [Amylostereum chailletii]|nr:hypothetical protein OF83DRAFT_1136737 [Amylostereum chailletii]
MSDAKRRGPGRKSKGKTLSLPNQKTLFDHFSQAKRGDAEEDGQNIIANDASPPNDPLAEPLPIAPPSAPEVLNDHHQSHVDDTVTTLADHSNLLYPVDEVRGSTVAVDKIPPKKVFPIFERRITRSATLASANLTLPVEDSAAVGPEPKPSVDKLPVASKPNVSRRPRPLQPTSSFPIPSSSKQMLDLTSDDGSQSMPIVIDLSPVRPSREQAPNGRSRNCSPAPVLPRPRKSRRPDTSLHPLLPDANSQHVRGTQNTFVASSDPVFRKQRKERVAACDSPLSSGHFSWDALLVPQSKPRSPHPPSQKLSVPIPRSNENSRPAISRPAISRFFDSSTRPIITESDTLQQYWNERWRPSRADQVLGNERSACYIRDWMHALRLHFSQPPGTPSASQPGRQPTRLRKSGSQSKAAGKRKARKGPTVIREVKRPRKRLRRGNDLDGFIANDEESAEEEESGNFSTEDDDFFDPTTPAPENHDGTGQAEEGSFPSTPFVFGNKICNTILLTGPPGSGKTASVYACADELGWSVFEVYPGMGKRGGANLDGLIGDVGKNHTLPQPVGPSAQTARIPVKQGAFYAFWGSGNKTGSRFHDADCQQDGSDVHSPNANADAACNSAPAKDGPTDQGLSRDEVTPTQSVILFEEVDVLFGDDAGFWNAAIAFIKECKRPVVMTCNDMSMVPTADLPLQDIIKFRHPSRELVASSLQSLCLAEGLDVACDPFLRGITGGIQTDDPDLPEDTNVPLDLRQCINQLQLGLPIGTNATLSVFIDPLEGIHDGESDEVDLSLRPRAAGLNSHRQLRWLYEAEKKTARASFLDAYLIQCPLSRYELSAGHPDAEVGYTEVRTVPRGISPVVPELYSEHYNMASMVATRTGPTVGDENCAELRGEWYAVDDCGGVFSRVRDALEGQVLDTTWALDKGALMLDYAPWIREIGYVEQRDAEKDAMKRDGKGRQTQNSQGARLGRDRMVTNWEVLKETSFGTSTT